MLLKSLRRLACATAVLLNAGFGHASAQTRVEPWTAAAMPSPPAPEAVTVDPAHTALLVLDMYATFCSNEMRPRCVQSIPQVLRLLNEARARRMMVIYSGGPPDSVRFNMPPPVLTPLPGEPMVRGPADKWMGTGLEKMLAARDIKTVIVIGTLAEGAVLYTASGAALRGFSVVVPLDAISSANAFGEVATAYVLKNTSGGITDHVTLTRSDLITLR